MSVNVEVVKNEQLLKTKKRSQMTDVWRRLRKSNTAIIGLVLIAIFLCLAIFAPFIADYEDGALKMNVRERLQSPGLGHWFGTDELGRDIFARIVYGNAIAINIVKIAYHLFIGMAGYLNPCINGFPLIRLGIDA